MTHSQPYRKANITPSALPCAKGHYRRRALAILKSICNLPAGDPGVDYC
ncbi:MAG: hypothetical protein H8E14_12410 [Candidatus Marinimicrobia bacterium]|nr:hypothetical protein [Candidatus Neomarinimicrobiota bacterium]